MTKGRIVALSLLAGFPILGCGKSGQAEGPQTVANARADIEALPYPIKITEPPKDRHVLILQMREKSGENFHYLVFAGTGVKSGPGLDVSGLLAKASLTEGYAVAHNEPAYPETRAERNERFNMEFAVEDALCKQATGESCAI